MRILTWNVRHGGGKRTAAIVERIKAFDSDIAVITEFRNNPWGDQIIDSLKDSGLSNVYSHKAEPKMNSVLLASKEPFKQEAISISSSEAHRCIVARYANFNLLGVYFAIGKKKIPLYEALEGIVPDLLTSPTLLIGDFNTGKHYLDEMGATFKCTDHFGKLEELGLIDAWRTRNPKRTEYTWYSTAGNGFRLDHALVSDSFNDHIRSIRYSHSEREDKLSDHSALVLDVENFA